jgi:F-type H+-transporting ATPase subunit gamma
MRAIQRRKSAAQIIGKLTRAMAMVASLKLQKLRPRTLAAQAYAQGLRDMVKALAGMEEPGDARPRSNRTALLVITSDRGLVGAYNSNMVRLAKAFIQSQQAVGVTVELHVRGRKGIAQFRAHQRPFVPIGEQSPEIPSATDLETMAAYFTDLFRYGRIDAFDVAHTRFINVGRQHPLLLRLLPPAGAGVYGVAATGEYEEGKRQPARPCAYELSPGADVLMSALLPLTVRASLLECFLSSMTSESAARRITTLRATENANDVSRTLTSRYNRARQAHITNELMSIISGAEAVRTAR